MVRRRVLRESRTLRGQMPMRWRDFRGEPPEGTKVRMP